MGCSSCAIYSLTTVPPRTCSRFSFSARWIYAYETGVALLCLAVTIGGAKAFAKASMVIFVVVMISVVTYVLTAFDSHLLSSTAARGAARDPVR